MAEAGGPRGWLKRGSSWLTGRIHLRQKSSPGQNLDKTWTKLDRFLSFSGKAVLDRNWTELDRILSFEGTDYRRRLLPAAAMTQDDVHGARRRRRRRQVPRPRPRRRWWTRACLLCFRAAEKPQGPLGGAVADSRKGHAIAIACYEADTNAGANRHSRRG